MIKMLMEGVNGGVNVDVKLIEKCSKWRCRDNGSGKWRQSSFSLC